MSVLNDPQNRTLVEQLPTVIAFAGQARSGKDTSGLIVERLGKTRQLNVQRYAFADPIRAALNAMFGIDMYSQYWIDRKEQVIPWLGKSPRQIMQTLGTEWGREHVHENLWVVLAQRKLLECANLGVDVLIITDYRFPNEGDWLEALGACVIHVDRPGQQVIASSGHASENKMPKRANDYHLINDGDLIHLENKLRCILKDFHRTQW